MPDFIKVCEQAARAGGDVLLKWQQRIQAREKGPKDLVTQADIESQEVIQEILLNAFPNHGFVGEEDPQDAAAGPPQEGEYCWVVDPLDGTANYVHGLQSFAVSIALRCGADVVAGTVYDPIRDECYNAVQGQGAWLNGTAIAVSGCRVLQEALVAVSFPANVPRDCEEIAGFIEVLHRSRAVRRLGSAALNLSYLAAGRLDGYWASSVKIWDVAAGVLLVQEAGGVVSGLSGNAFDLDAPNLATAASSELHAELMSALTNLPER
ncbi:MAG: inositol monophosphatase [Planctomycetaceae bacterium]|nr:inositol monophosphatase [Planctomycetaceae bacterium]HAA68006.1 inositol monophosphatase [Planctomycetaceae bacterium]|tara:strand:+ start:13956 stop:14750 length:795 start_codon:yes stop_codon:yes gene_type:complete